MIHKTNVFPSWKLGFLADGINAYCSNSDICIDGGVYTHSAEVQPGGLYVARRGEKNDGHNYIGKAKQAGAAAVIVEDPTEAIAHDIPYLLVKNATLALGAIAKLHLASLRHNSNSSPIVIGITGSAGKTTTKDLLFALLSELGNTVAPEKSFNNEVGLPLTILRATTDTKYLVLEMGASAPGELTYLTEIAPLDYAVELMVGSAHLGGYGTVEALAKAKAEMLSGLRNFAGVEKYRAQLPREILQGLEINEAYTASTGEEKVQLSKAVINLDDQKVRNFLFPGPQVLGFASSGSNPAEYRVPIQVKTSRLTADQRVIATVEIESQEILLELGLNGAHNLSNALAAATVAYDLGLSAADIKRIINTHKALSAHRMNIFETKSQILVIDDAYNANLDSMKAGIKVLHNLGVNRCGRTVAVLGAMLELGEKSDTLHRQLAIALKEAKIDQVFATGNPIKVLADVLENSTAYTYCETIEDIELELRKFIRQGDTLLLKGSNGSGIWKIADRILEEGGIQ